MKKLEVRLIRIENILVAKVLNVDESLVDELDEQDGDTGYTLLSNRGSVDFDEDEFDVGSNGGIISYKCDSISEAKSVAQAIKRLVNKVNSADRELELDIETIL